MISIIIINYNSLEETKNCIESIFKYTTNISYEIILVDNASTNQEELNNLLKYNNIKIIKNAINKGFAAGCNDGIKAAKGDYILLLNNDTILKNNAILSVYEFIKTKPDIAFATCKVLDEHGNPQGVCKSFFTISKLAFELLRLNKVFPKKITAKYLWGAFFNYDEYAYPDWIAGTFMMFRKSILKIFPNNKLPETFWMYYEDMEWCWLARKAGYKNAFIPDGVIIHLSKSKTFFYNQLVKNNLKAFLFKYHNYFYATIVLFLYNLLLKQNEI
ncbi:MAG: glycosyltransferase family 2 protein [Bacteroidales bacterium]|nr:glycosyltransferase family 2 protein [Bacteroidales bacterium]